MFIVIDSTEFCADFIMSGQKFRLLMYWLRITDNILCVPQIVIEEVANKYSESLKRPLKGVQELRRMTQGILSNSDVIGELSKIDVDVTTQIYRNHLLQKISDVGGRILPVPSVPHEQLIMRAINNKKPFADSGKGYRDALIWESVIELLRQEPEPVKLVTQNEKDFGLEGQLHPDLAKDLTEGRTRSADVELVVGLGAFVPTYVTPELEEADEAAVEMESGRYLGRNLTDFVAEGVQFIIGDELDPSDIGFPNEFESPTISLLEDPSTKTVTSMDLESIDAK